MLLPNRAGDEERRWLNGMADTWIAAAEEVEQMLETKVEMIAELMFRDDRGRDEPAWLEGPESTRQTYRTYARQWLGHGDTKWRLL